LSHRFKFVAKYNASCGLRTHVIDKCYNDFHTLCGIYSADPHRNFEEVTVITCEQCLAELVRRTQPPVTCINAGMEIYFDTETIIAGLFDEKIRSQIYYEIVSALRHLRPNENNLLQRSDILDKITSFADQLRLNEPMSDKEVDDLQNLIGASSSAIMRINHQLFIKKRREAKERLEQILDCFPKEEVNP